MTIEAMNLALECLSSVVQGDYDGNAHDAIIALRQAIKQAEQAQPKASIIWGAKRGFASDPEWAYKFSSLPSDTTSPPRQPDHMEDNLKMVEQAQPVAWRYTTAKGAHRYCKHRPNIDMASEYAILEPIPLYTSPPPRQPESKADNAKLQQAYVSRENRLLRKEKFDLILQKQELLAALQAIINDGMHCDVVPNLHEKARAAIAKATGGAA